MNKPDLPSRFRAEPDDSTVWMYMFEEEAEGRQDRERKRNSTKTALLKEVDRSIVDSKHFPSSFATLNNTEL